MKCNLWGVGGACPGKFSGAYLGEAFLLQISDDALAKQIRRANEIQDFVIVVTDERKLEPIFSGINGDGTRPSGTVQAMHSLALDTSQVHWVVEGTNNPVITVVGKVNSMSRNGGRRQTPGEDSI
jgi:hypothetical protein